MNEQDLDKILEEQRERTHMDASEQQFQKKIRRAMSHSLYSRIMASILLFVLLAGGICFGTSKAMDLMFYAPQKEAPFLEPGGRQGAEFALLLEDTISTYFPGKYCLTVDGYERQGFGRYGIDLQITDIYGPRTLPGPVTDHFSIRFSKLDVGHPPLFILAREFLDPEYPYAIAPDESSSITPISTIRRELADLPRSAYLDVSLSSASSLTSDEMADLIRAYPDVHFRWLALEGQNTTKYKFAAGGMFLDHVFEEDLTEEAESLYPDYFLPSEITGADLEQCLISRLQLLVDHPEFVALMESKFGDLISMPMLRERLANAKENWACYGMRVAAGPEDIEALMDELSATQAVINDVKVSSYQK